MDNSDTGTSDIDLDAQSAEGKAEHTRSFKSERKEAKIIILSSDSESDDDLTEDDEGGSRKINVAQVEAKDKPVPSTKRKLKEAGSESELSGDENGMSKMKVEMPNTAEQSLPIIPVSTMSLLRNETFSDTVCLVGPQKFPIKCHQLFLKVASPVIETMLAEKWNLQVNQVQSKSTPRLSSSSATSKKIDGDAFPNSKKPKLTTQAETVEIQLTDVDEQTFQTFLLFIYDQTDARKHLMELSNIELINLLHFAHRFLVKMLGDECCRLLLNRIKVENVIEIHQGASFLGLNVLKNKTSSYILEHFATIMADASFSGVENQFLLEFLPNDKLNMNELDLFQGILSWTESQLEKMNKKITKAALRQVLGDALFHIRFPAMTASEFAKATSGVQFLSFEETVDIFRIICLNDLDKQNINTRFCTRKRINNRPQVCCVYLFEQLKASNTLPIVCDGSSFYTFFQVSQEIEINAVGFLGPIDKDSEYDITLRLTGFNPKETFLDMSKRVMAKQGELFFLRLGKPVTLDGTDMNQTFKTKYYRMKFTLKGPNTSSPILGSPKKCYSVSSDGVDFYFGSAPTPMAALSFKRL